MNRRQFLRLTAAAGALPFDRRSAQLQDLPKLDGTVTSDTAALLAAAIDGGGLVERLPRAVLRPGSVADVERMVLYANQHHLPIAMRGRGHSVYGQSLAHHGLVIDSRSLGAARMAGNRLDVQAGASLLDAARTALDAGFALPVMSPCTMLSVGGFVSVGGESLGTRRHGAFVDQVAELDVVIGAGKLVTCSEQTEPQLFQMMLAGLGQCGIIVAARLWVLPAPSSTATRVLTYGSLEDFLHDQIRLASDLRFDHVVGRIVPGPGGTWVGTTTVTTLGLQGQAPDPQDALQGYKPARISDLTRMSYREYVLGANRPLTGAADSTTGLKESDAIQRRPPAQPSFAAWLPARAGHDLIRILLGTPRETAGVTGILCRALPTHVFKRPLFRVPAEETMFAFWLMRTVVPGHGATLAQQLQSNARFWERADAIGAKRYPPYGGWVDQTSDWRRHYGENLYRRLGAAKRRYDPQNVLTPGERVF